MLANPDRVVIIRTSQEWSWQKRKAKTMTNNIQLADSTTVNPTLDFDWNTSKVKVWVLIQHNDGKLNAWRDYGDHAWGASTYKVIGWFKGSHRDAIKNLKELDN